MSRRQDYFFSFFLTFIAISSVPCNSLKLPSYIKPCNGTDPKLFRECALKNGREALPDIVEGDSKYHIPSFKPFKLNQVNLEQSQNIKISASDVEIHGFDTMELKDLKWDLEAKLVSLDLFSPLVQSLGIYNMDGHILMFTMTGSGALNNTYYNNEITVDISYDVVSRHNKQYFSIKNLKLKWMVDYIHFSFDNLLNNPQLSAQINTFLNENWQVMYNEIEVSMQEVVEKIVVSILQPLADKIPFDEIILF